MLFFPPYNHRMLPAPDTEGEVVINECKRRVADLARPLAHAVVVDFMLPGPITAVDDNYWDGLHYRTFIGDRIRPGPDRGGEGGEFGGLQVLFFNKTDQKLP